MAVPCLGQEHGLLGEVVTAPHPAARGIVPGPYFAHKTGPGLAGYEEGSYIITDDPEYGTNEFCEVAYINVNEGDKETADLFAQAPALAVEVERLRGALRALLDMVTDNRTQGPEVLDAANALAEGGSDA